MIGSPAPVINTLADNFNGLVEHAFRDILFSLHQPNEKRSAALDVETERNFFVRWISEPHAERYRYDREDYGDESFPRPEIGGEIPAEEHEPDELDKKHETGTHCIFDFGFSISDWVIVLTISTLNLTLSRLEHIRDRGFLHLDFHVVGHLHNDGRVFDIRNQPVNSGRSDDAIAGFQR